jgi:putative tryptophan/tyrosine transport system substrate-binding protein
MRRREFITLLGSAAAAWPLSARAQQPANVPLVGFLNSASSDTYRFNADSFREGLARAGFVEGRNVRIEERWANSDYGALPQLAAELVAKRVVAIAATGDVASARAAQNASSTIPVVFTIGGDPVRHGLVQSINRPGGHVTGILFNQNVLAAKRVELLREIAPNVSRVALLMNPANLNVKIEIADAEAGAKKLGLETVVVSASNAREMDAAFEEFMRVKADSLITATDPITLDRREQIVSFANRHKTAGGVFRAPVRNSGRASELWPQHQLDVPPGRRICCANPERRETGRDAGPAADPIRTGDQPEDRKGVRDDRAARAAGACRRGDRITNIRSGTKRTYRHVCYLSALGGIVLQNSSLHCEGVIIESS